MVRHRPQLAQTLLAAAVFAQLWLPAVLGGESVSVAAASNLVYALDALDAAFRQAAPGVTLTTTTGASGSLVAQIGQGAPFDVFLSADLDYPRALIAAHHADPASLRIFAIGELVAWTTRLDLPLGSIPALVRDPRVKKIAIANLTTAPYGRAAQQALEKLGVWTVAQPKLVIGENITQTAQFVATGGADLGFVARSLVLAPALKDSGRWVVVPGSLHTPLEHAAVLTRRGAANPAARRYLEFLTSDAARKILLQFGYGPPGEGKPGRD